MRRLRGPEVRRKRLAQGGKIGDRGTDGAELERMGGRRCELHIVASCAPVVVEVLERMLGLRCDRARGDPKRIRDDERVKGCPSDEIRGSDSADDLERLTQRTDDLRAFEAVELVEIRHDDAAAGPPSARQVGQQVRKQERGVPVDRRHLDPP